MEALQSSQPCKVLQLIKFPISFKGSTLNDGPLLNQVKRRWNLQQNNIIKTCFYPNLCELSGTSYKYKHK
jgi:hypothetical protein